MAENERKDDNTGDSGGKSPKKLRVLLRTFGCQMNVRDSEVILGLLKKEDYAITGAQENANIIIFNTCSVRQHAEDKVWSEIGRIAKGKSQQPLIGVVGCMAQNYQEQIFKRAPQVDFVVGPSDIHKIPKIIKKLSAEKKGQSPTTEGSPERSRGKSGDSPFFLRKVWETDAGIRPEEIYHTGFYVDEGHAYVVISEGCLNFCSYCVVPYVRGALRHRNYKDILNEIEGAVDQGITRITLLGQNVNAYRYDNVNFIELIRLVNLVKGLKEFSFITSHPKDTSCELFKAMADSERLKKYLHLPVQSGSDRILKLMNRTYAKEYYLGLAQDYRKIVKDGVLTTDIIVGFPTETQKDFQETYDLVKKVRFNAAYIFKYSPRPNTAALTLGDDVARQEKQRRHSLILQLQKEISRKNK